MAKQRRGSRTPRGVGRAARGRETRGGESGGFLGQLGLYETGSASAGPLGIILAIGLAVLTYPIFWVIRTLRRRSR